MGDVGGFMSTASIPMAVLNSESEAMLEQLEHAFKEEQSLPG